MRRGVDSFFTVQLGTPRGRYDEHSSKFFPQKETKVYRIQEKANTPESDADYPTNTPTRAPLTILVDSSSTNSNAEPAHNTTKYFAPKLR
jgi:hypothetical protein